MRNAAFGQFAKYVYSLIFTLSFTLVPGSHAAYGDKITGKFLSQFSTTGPLKLESAQVITDNDDSFKSKLAAIDSAQDSIDIIYYIFAEDFSSSKFSERLIKAAQRGVKVRILVDYLTNLTRADLFLALESASENISIKLYNKPTKNILHDAVFMTTACAEGYKGCARKKDEKSVALKTKGNGTDFMSRLFLTGLYSKTMDLLKLSVFIGQNIDLDDMKSGAEASPEDIAKLKEFGKLIYRARIKGEVSANLKLWMAFQMYGEQVGPIYDMITATLPLDSKSTSTDDWAYLTDYTHHKFLLVDGHKFQIGGRNVEDSYHVKTNDMYQGEDKKYIFMDTDFYAEVKADSGLKLKSSFDRLWDFDTMTSTLAEVDSVTELDAIARPDLAAQAVMSCKGQKELSICAETAFDKLMLTNARTRSVRLSEKLNQVASKSADFDRLHRTNTSTVDRINDQDGKMSAADLERAQIYYIENLPFSKASWLKRKNTGAKLVRQYGASVTNEGASNKNIHELLVRGLQQACVDSNREKKNKTVVLHNAYFFPSPNIIRTFGEMITGSRSCGRVTVKIITNSYQTTDLFPVNAFASAQLKAIFETQNSIQNNRRNRRAKNKAAKFEYYEYQKGSADDQRSLHTKVSVLGNDMIIGSANLDIRSYAMDTNNGVYIRNAKGLVADYNAYITKLIKGDVANMTLVNRTSELMNAKVSKEQFAQQQLAIIKAAISMMSPKGAALFVDEALPGETPEQFKTRTARRKAIETLVLDTMDLLYDSTKLSLLTTRDSDSRTKSARSRMEKAVMSLLSVI